MGRTKCDQYSRVLGVALLEFLARTRNLECGAKCRCHVAITMKWCTRKHKDPRASPSLPAVAAAAVPDAAAVLVEVLAELVA